MVRSRSETLDQLLAELRACRICAENLPLGPRPVLRLERTARLLIVGQAPGTKVHQTGVPWDDASGDRLRQWLGLDRDTFYDASRVAIVPMGFCYPGRHARGGDLPPRPECAAQWLERLLAHLPERRFTLLVGAYAQRHYLGQHAAPTLTETVRAWRDYLPEFGVTAHPSFRNNVWLRRNAWFEEETIPAYRKLVHRLLS